jgi:pilus assembly protein Flp/PilA
MLKIQMLIQKLVRPVQNDEGANAIEYGLIAALISVVIIASVTIVGTELVAVFTAVSDALAGA